MDEMKYTMKEILESRLGEMNQHLQEIKSDVKEAKQGITVQNGRVRTLEDWSHDAQKMIENTTAIANETLSSYKVDKVRLWTAITVMLFVGGAIITLSIMAIDSKIQTGISDALSTYDIELQK